MIRRRLCKAQRALFVGALGLLFLSGCIVPYVMKQAVYQGKLLCGAEPVDALLEGSKLSATQRSKLLFVKAVRSFAVSDLGFNNSENYTTFNPNWHQELLNVSASKPLEFRAYNWYFPIVGWVPFKGFFDRQDALSERDFLKSRGYDTLVQSVAGYSTLGYFKDPLWPKMLESSDGQLAELILHELAHATLYFKSQTDFNESFANFAGRAGALQFLKQAYGGQSDEVLQLERYYEDERTYASWARRLIERLDQVYKGSQTDPEKLELKQKAIDEARDEFAKIPFSSRAFQGARAPQINNAFLLMFRRYNRSQDLFAQLLAKCSNDWRKMLKVLRTMSSSSDPFEALSEKISQMPSPS